MEIFLKKLLHFRFGYAIINKLFGVRQYAPLAQLDRASGYGPEGREFESCHVHLFNLAYLQGFFII